MARGGDIDSEEEPFVIGSGRDGQGVTSSSATSSIDASTAPPPSTASLAILILLSICSSVSLILVNKALMNDFNFRFVMTQTTLHFLSTFIALSVCAQRGVFQVKRLSLVQSVLVAAAGVGSIVFMNLSLRENSVGTYQVLKLLVIPTVIGITMVVRGEKYPKPVLISLGVLLTGVAFATISDVTMKAAGLLVGAIAVVATAQFQVWQGSKQKEFAVSAVQLTHCLAPFQAAITFTASLAFDYTPQCLEKDPIPGCEKFTVLTYPFDAGSATLLAISCVIAISVNLCSMGLIGKTSAVTYQVVGHAKTCLVFIGGFLLFPTLAGWALYRTLFGIGVAMSGVVAYGYFKMRK